MAYSRARRLSNAAIELAKGSKDILGIALDAQYNSHEAFTRAFANYFGVLPSTIAKARSTKNLNLQEPLKMDKSRIVDIAAPQIKDHDTFNVTGLSLSCNFEKTNQIPRLWNAFNQRDDEVSSTNTVAAYGVCYNADSQGNFMYMAGIESQNGAPVPNAMEVLTIAKGKYAVFEHKGHISDISNTVYTIWNKSLPDLGLAPRQTPDFERYDAKFDKNTGRGTVEIWIPISD